MEPEGGFEPPAYRLQIGCAAVAPPGLGSFPSEAGPLRFGRNKNRPPISGALFKYKEGQKQASMERERPQGSHRIKCRLWRETATITLVATETLLSLGCAFSNPDPGAARAHLAAGAAAADHDHLGQDRDCDLLGSLGADVKADRRVYALEGLQWKSLLTEMA